MASVANHPLPQQQLQHSHTKTSHISPEPWCLALPFATAIVLQGDVLHCTCNVHNTFYSLLLPHRLPEILIMNVAFTNRELRVREVVSPGSLQQLFGAWIGFLSYLFSSFVLNMSPVSQYLVLLMTLWRDHQLFLTVDEAEECLAVYRQLCEGLDSGAVAAETGLLSSCVPPVPSSASAWVSFLHPFIPSSSGPCNCRILTVAAKVTLGFTESVGQPCSVVPDPYLGTSEADATSLSRWLVNSESRGSDWLVCELACERLRNRVKRKELEGSHKTQLRLRTS